MLITLLIATALKLGWMIPPSRAVLGDSYVLGFNNFVCTAAIGAGLVLTLLWLLIAFRGRYADAPLNAALFDLFGSEPHALTKDRRDAGQHRRLRLGYTVAVTAAVGLVGVWYLVVAVPYFGESNYFLPRLELLVEGQRPYRDFEFGYGPLLIYPVFWLYKSYGGLLALDDAYTVVLLLQFALGFAALWFVVAHLRISTRAKAVILLGQCLFWLNPSLGLQYTPLRFIYPVFALTYLWTKSSPTASASWRTSVSTLVLAIVGFGISPEIGVATLLSMIVLHGWALLVQRQTAAALPLVAVGSALPLVVVSFGTSYFHTILGFGGGGLGFPVLPLPYTLVFLAAAFVLIPALALSSLTRRMAASSAFFAALAVCLGLSLPAALGRCDPGHVGSNGLPVLLLAAALGSSWSSRWGRALCWLGYAVVLLTALISFWWLYWERIIEVVRDRAMISLILPYRPAPRLFDTRLFRTEVSFIEQADAEHAQIENALPKKIRERFVWSKLLYWDDTMMQMLKYPSIGTPLNCDDPDILRFLHAAGRYTAGYHVAPADNAFSAADIERKILDLALMPAVLVPKKSMTPNRALSDDARLELFQKFYIGRAHWMNKVLLSPWTFTPIRVPFDDIGPIRREIVTRYERVGEIGEYDLMVRRNPEVSGPP